MFLARQLAEHPSQVRADLQRFFGLNLDRLGDEFSAFHAASCLANLPLGASLLSACEPRLQWTQTDYLLHGIMSIAAGKEIPFPWEGKKHGIEGIETESLPLDQFIEWYEKSNWKEVEEWHKEIQ